MTREEKIELLNRLLEIEEKNDIGNLTSMNRREFQQWVEEIEQESVLDKIRAEIGMYEADCKLQGGQDECEECNSNVFGSIYRIIDKYKAESEE